MKQRQIAAITSDRHRSTLGGILPEGTLYYVDSNPNVRGKLSEWEDMNVDVVVIDDDGMPYKDVSETDLYTYPATARRKMQIIFIPAAARRRDDPFLSRLVNVGIYDIVDPQLGADEARAMILRMIDRPSLLSDALSYFGEGATPFVAKKRRRLPKIGGGRKEQSPSDSGPFASGEGGSAEEAKPTAASLPEAQAKNVYVPVKPAEGHAADPEPGRKGFEAPLEAPASTMRYNALEKLRVLGERCEAPEGKASASASLAQEGGCDAPPSFDAADAEPSGEADAGLARVDSGTGSPADGSGYGDGEACGTVMSGDEIEAVADAVFDLVMQRVDLEIAAKVDAMVNSSHAKASPVRASKTRKVGVAEICSNAGSTETALGLAFFLARRWPGQKVGVAFSDRAKLNALLPAGGSFHGLEHKGVTLAMMGDPKLEDLDWLVTDCGVLHCVLESKAKTAFATAGLKCICASVEPWRAPKVKEVIDAYDAVDRTTWTWCFKNSPRAYIEKCVASVAGDKSKKIRYYELPNDPDYYYGESDADYYDLVRPLLPHGGRQQRGKSSREDAS